MKPQKLQARKLETLKQKPHPNELQSSADQNVPDSKNVLPNNGLTDDLSSNLAVLKEKMGYQSDVRFSEFPLSNTEKQVALVYIDGLNDLTFINDYVIKPLKLYYSEQKESKEEQLENDCFIGIAKRAFLTGDGVEELTTFEQVIQAVYAGFTIMLLEGASSALKISAKKVKSRPLEEPITEATVKGPRIGFNETLSENTALLRLRVSDPQLTMTHFKVGRTNKDLVVVYMKDIANDELVREVQKRIKNIDIDDVAGSGYIEQLIEDDYLSPFPQVQDTERPDRFISSLMEGRVGILLDGSPFSLMVPATFSMFLQTPEDYYERWIPSSFIRLLRFFAALVSLFLPSIYIAFVSFHQGLIPTQLAISISATRESVPFPSVIEALIMEVAIEILREAGLRLPKTVGQTVGLVGGLVIGQAAVQAGIVSPIMVIVVSLTAISSFAIPQYSAGISLRLLRFGAMLFSALLGLFGVILFFLIIAIHFVKLKSFGVPYATPATPYRLGDWKDFIFRAPIFKMNSRPKMLFTKNTKRQSRRK
ncbi:spore germination protein [Shimazuella kribbensis]|uniref:spore germination protein n=1 Tax=Shimazuella kribbensis TaxID=139808 RepID=UPI00049123E8